MFRRRARSSEAGETRPDFSSEVEVRLDFCGLFLPEREFIVFVVRGPVVFTPDPDVTTLLGREEV